MLTPAKKKYLFSIYEIGLQKAIIRSVDIARTIQISKASVCNMLPVLVDDGLIEKDSDRIIALTDEGEALAGIKPANIAACHKSKYPDLYGEFDKLNSELNHKDIYIEILCECERRALVRHITERGKTLA